MRLRLGPLRKRKTIMVLLSGALVAAVAIVGTATALHGHGKRPSTRAASKSAAQASDGRVRSISLQDKTVVVTGGALDVADSTRTMWYATVEGAAFGEQAAADSLTRKVTDPSGTALATETDPIQVGTPRANGPLRLSEDEIRRAEEKGAATVGAKLVAVNYVPLFGGTAEVVVQPDDLSSFLRNPTAIAAFLGLLSADNGAYLLTVVNAKQAPMLITGWTPGVGGGEGQGVAWHDPSLHALGETPA